MNEPIPGSGIAAVFAPCPVERRVAPPSAWAIVARDLGVELAMLRALARVEAPRGAFDNSGVIACLFERHLFRRYTDGRFDGSHPFLSNQSAGGYGKYREQPSRIAAAAALHQRAALEATSWGRFQVLGRWADEMGYGTPYRMAIQFALGELEQLEGLGRYLRLVNPKALAHLRTKNFEGLADAYNGRGHARHNYAGRFAAAYHQEVQHDASGN